MTESFEAAPAFLHAPDAIIDEHLNNVASRPGTAALRAAGEIIRASYQGFNGTRDTMGVCIDLTGQIADSTTILAEMFAANSNDLPQHWRSNSEITRTVLSISGYIELGYLQAQRVALAHEGGDPRIDTRITAVEGLIAVLQTK